MRLKGLIESLGSLRIYSHLEDFEVKGISCNSKKVADNYVFVAIKGNNIDGNAFIEDALGRGAKAVIVQGQEQGVMRPAVSDRRVSRLLREVRSFGRFSLIEVSDTRRALARLAAEFYGHPSRKIKVIGITGTNGKTTVSYLLEAILKRAGFNPAVIGTVNYRFKDKLIPAKNTTPDAVELQSMLADMVKENVDYAVMEVSSHALDQYRTDSIAFHSAIFTNLTQDHLDYHDNLENYFQAKLKLFKDIAPNSCAVINHDDKYGRRIKELTPSRTITYGIKDQADVGVKEISLDMAHTEFLVTYLKQEARFKMRLIGEHNVYNTLAAVAWALNEGLDLAIIKSSVESFELVPGRLERVDFKGNFWVFVDYAHTEDALKNVIIALRRLSRNKVIVVFGCGGERDKTKRPKMGRVVSELADYAIITNDNPRSEDPLEIIRDIKKGIRASNYLVVTERSEAIKKSLSLAGPGDIVLIAGKGHEHYQIFKDRTIPFDDCQVARECLMSMKY